MSTIFRMQNPSALQQIHRNVSTAKQMDCFAIFAVLREFLRTLYAFDSSRNCVVFAYPNICKRTNKKCTLFTDKVQDKKVKESIASQTSEYALDWKFRYEKGVDEFYNTYTECGICKLGIRENCFEFVPCLCNMDERNYRNEGGQLHRTKTLAQGDDCCDFHVTKIKSES